MSQLPEMGHLSPGERATIIRDLGGWKLYAGLFLRSAFHGGLAGLLIGGIISSAIPNPMPDDFVEYFIILTTVIGGLLYYQHLVYRLRRGVREEMKRQLAGRPSPVCFGCGYNLEGSEKSDTCPECGAAVVVAPPRRSD